NIPRRRSAHEADTNKTPAPRVHPCVSVRCNVLVLKQCVGSDGPSSGPIRMLPVWLYWIGSLTDGPAHKLFGNSPHRALYPLELCRRGEMSTSQKTAVGNKPRPARTPRNDEHVDALAPLL